MVSKENLSDVQRAYGETLSDRYGKKRRKIRERNVVYDVEDFARQLRRLRRHYKQDGGLRTGAEYLSGIRELDKLIPNITILLYHGIGKWDAETCRR